MMSTPREECLRTLGFSGNELEVKPEDIKKAYLNKAKQFHPDKNSNSDSKVEFQKIKKAYELLNVNNSLDFEEVTTANMAMKEKFEKKKAENMAKGINKKDKENNEEDKQEINDQKSRQECTGGKQSEEENPEINDQKSRQECTGGKQIKHSAASGDYKNMEHSSDYKQEGSQDQHSTQKKGSNNKRYENNNPAKKVHADNEVSQKNQIPILHKNMEHSSDHKQESSQDQHSTQKKDSNNIRYENNNPAKKVHADNEVSQKNQIPILNKNMEHSSDYKQESSQDQHSTNKKGSNNIRYENNNPAKKVADNENRSARNEGHYTKLEKNVSAKDSASFNYWEEKKKQDQTKQYEQEDPEIEEAKKLSKETFKMERGHSPEPNEAEVLTSESNSKVNDWAEEVEQEELEKKTEQKCSESNFNSDNGESRSYSRSNPTHNNFGNRQRGDYRKDRDFHDKPKFGSRNNEGSNRNFREKKIEHWKDDNRKNTDFDQRESYKDKSNSEKGNSYNKHGRRGPDNNTEYRPKGYGQNRGESEQDPEKRGDAPKQDYRKHSNEDDKTNSREYENGEKFRRRNAEDEKTNFDKRDHEYREKRGYDREPRKNNDPRKYRYQEDKPKPKGGENEQGRNHGSSYPRKQTWSKSDEGRGYGRPHWNDREERQRGYGRDRKPSSENPPKSNMPEPKEDWDLEIQQAAQANNKANEEITYQANNKANEEITYKNVSVSCKMEDVDTKYEEASIDEMESPLPSGSDKLEDNTSSPVVPSTEMVVKPKYSYLAALQETVPLPPVPSGFLQENVPLPPVPSGFLQESVPLPPVPSGFPQEKIPLLPNPIQILNQNENHLPSGFNKPKEENASVLPWKEHPEDKIFKLTEELFPLIDSREHLNDLFEKWCTRNGRSIPRYSPRNEVDFSNPPPAVFLQSSESETKLRPPPGLDKDFMQLETQVLQKDFVNPAAPMLERNLVPTSQAFGGPSIYFPYYHGLPPNMMCHHLAQCMRDPIAQLNTYPNSSYPVPQLMFPPDMHLQKREQQDFVQLPHHGLPGLPMNAFQFYHTGNHAQDESANRNPSNIHQEF